MKQQMYNILAIPNQIDLQNILLRMTCNLNWTGVEFALIPD